jgi:hypothetical protein
MDIDVVTTAINTMTTEEGRKDFASAAGSQAISPETVP